MIRVAVIISIVITFVSSAFAEDYTPPPVGEDDSLVEEEATVVDEEATVVDEEEPGTPVLRNDERDFLISVDDVEYRDEHAYRFLGHPDLGDKFRGRKMGKTALIAGGFGAFTLGAIMLISGTISYLSWGMGNAPPIVGVLAAGGMGGIIGGLALMAHGGSRSNHPVSPGERMELIRQFDAGR